MNLLRQGGYVIYFRHTKTDFSQKDTVADYDNCAGQRNLTDEGRTQAKDIGVAMKVLGIPVGRVVASPYCRTRETAQLAYAVYVDAKDGAWVTDFGNNTIVNYSPSRREWKSYALPSPNANVRQLLGHNVETWHEVWGAESGANKLVVVRAE